ncbi:MAG: ABC transporter ATP-binding protein [Promethearchaeota archaeon]
MSEIIHNHSVINLKGISKNYKVGEIDVNALIDVTLTIHQGELIVILGPSGSGKTTLLNMIGAIDVPSKGQVNVLGYNLTKANRHALAAFRRQHVGFIFQFFNLLPTLTALENVEYAILLQKKKNAQHRAREVLKEVGLEERVNHFPSELSGGEQQRVAIARALAKQTDLILADEPTGELDYETGIQILKLLVSAAINGNKKRTILIVTHNADIAKIADRVIRLRSGKVISDSKNPSPIDPEELRW